MEKILFCPYCGDDLSDDTNKEFIEEYVNERGICPHWDDQNRFSEF
ncbi:hypothetical protein SMD22_00770 (plasmid) [Brevibacillus halotolerans]|nr:hypothetical protein SMD22_00770 [Brevibacillus halotolerans]